MSSPLNQNPRAILLAAAVGLSALACSVYESSLLGNGAQPNGASGDDSLGGTASVPGGGTTGVAGTSSNAGSSGDQAMSDAGSSIGGAPLGSGGTPTSGGDAAAGESNGGKGGSSGSNAGGASGGRAGSGSSVGGGGSSVGGGGSSAGSGGNTGTLHELAKGKSVTVSTQQTENAGAQGNDGDTSTRWAASGPSFPQWWRVDLGANHPLVRVSIRFEHPERTYYYLIETSTDDAVYTRQITASGTGVTQDLTLPANVTARYLRITVTNGLPVVVNGIGTWASFWECALMGY